MSWAATPTHSRTGAPINEDRRSTKILMTPGQGCAHRFLRMDSRKMIVPATKIA